MEGLSFSEIFVLIVIAVIIYGKDLPQAAGKLAKMYSKFKRQLWDVRQEIQRQIPMDEIERTINVDLPSGPGGEYPSTPSAVVASVDRNTVLLTWNSAVGASSYSIRRSTGTQDPWLIVAMNIAELSWTDTDVEAGKTYHYTISGVNSTGESGNSDEVVAVIPASEDSAAATPPPAADSVSAPGPAVDSASASVPAPPPSGNGNHAPEVQAPAPEVKPT
jgi:Sec-independent protein translocase protein TatA